MDELVTGVVSMLSFNRVEFPEMAKVGIELQGGKPKDAWVSMDEATGDIVVLLLSEEPSGDNGEWETHASLSVSTWGKRRFPNDFEINAARKHVAMSRKANRLMGNDMVVHLFEALR